jgi:integrase
MLSNRKSLARLPKLTHHKASGQGVVRLNGKDVYCGRYGTRECRARYLREIAEWEAANRQPTKASTDDPTAGTSDLTINEVMLAYRQFADSYYVKNGQPTSEAGNIQLAIRPLRELFGHSLAQDFGPLQLKMVRQAMIDGGLCRNEINRRIRLVMRAFKWAVAEAMVPPLVHHGLKAVDGLKKGRSGVRESEPVKPVPDAFVDAIRPYVSRQVWAMIELQRLTGMRPGEVCIMRTIDVDMSGRPWVYTPESHKTEHHDRPRRIHLGPSARENLQPWLRTELTCFLFSPAEAVAEHRAQRRRNRKSRVQPSQRDRRSPRPKRRPGERYTTLTYGQAITRAIARFNCEAEGAGRDEIPHWHPNQLRHNTATRLRREFGLEAAKAVLGHSSVMPTQVYAEQDESKAMEAMERVG